MPKEFIEFTETYTVKDHAETVYEKGSVHQLPVPAARHFVNRKVARFVDDDFKDEAIIKDDAASVDDVPETEWPQHAGGGWYELPNGQRIKGKAAAQQALAELVDAAADKKTLADALDPDAAPGKTLGE